MRAWISSRGGALALAAAMTALAGGSGCGETACFQWSSADQDAAGSCPSQADAKTFMTVPTTGFEYSCSEGKVLSVDSEGEWDGEACCYDVTKAEGLDDYCGY